MKLITILLIVNIVGASIYMAGRQTPRPNDTSAQAVDTSVLTGWPKGWSNIIINCKFLIDLFIIQCVNWCKKGYCSCLCVCWYYPVKLMPTCSNLLFISVHAWLPCDMNCQNTKTDHIHCKYKSSRVTIGSHQPFNVCRAVCVCDKIKVCPYSKLFSAKAIV